mmetsp:Transcript_39970/g.113316  ORF Transcript_39970/g.113316 Transcript_39970/m.113316 type:complete len:182 (+) Transcript_39970:177-722(+)
MGANNVVFAIALLAATASANVVEQSFEFQVESQQHRKLQQKWSFTEVWSEFLGSGTGAETNRAECPPNSFITNIRLSLNKYTAQGADTIAIGSMQGYCDDGTELPKFPPEAPNDIYFIVKQDGFEEFVGGSSSVLESFMFVGRSPADGGFSLACPTGLKLSGYQVRASTVVHAIKVKCSKV